MRYFRLNDDVEIADRWHLGDVSANSSAVPDLLIARKLPDAVRLSVSVSRPGRQLDFCLTSFGVPIASRELTDAIASVGKKYVQTIHIDIQGSRYRGEFCIPHCLLEVQCLDESRSDFIKWTEADGRPELVGHYRMVTRISIDRRALSSDMHYFRIAKWPVVLVISEVLMQEMQRVGCVGAKFEEIG